MIASPARANNNQAMLDCKNMKAGIKGIVLRGAAATLARCQRDTAAVIATYATKMRLTQRSTFDRTAVKHVSALPKPWDLSRPFDEPGDRCWSPTLDPRRQSGIARQINQNPSWAMVRLSTASAGPVSIGGTTTSW